MFNTPDMIAQHHLLDRISELVDQGKIITTVNSDGGMINARNLRDAHAHQESGRAVGKTVLAGFGG